MVAPSFETLGRVGAAAVAPLAAPEIAIGLAVL